MTTPIAIAGESQAHGTPLAIDDSHPLFAGFGWRDDLRTGVGIEQLNRQLRAHAGSAGLGFASQTPELLADGLHYEQRIAECGLIATRESNAHDLFNAQVWLRHTDLKRAMNARQVADIATVGTRERTRGQCALTHFDEAGAIAWIADRDLLPAWDAHDWPVFFGAFADRWGRSIAVTIVGHALPEYALLHGMMPVAKTLVVQVDRDALAARVDASAAIAAWPAAERDVAAAIADARLLADPQELRPLPLAGIPGWHSAQTAMFFASAPCFRPLRPGRRYPPPFAR